MSLCSVEYWVDVVLSCFKCHAIMHACLHTQEAHIIKADAPGLMPEDVNVQVTDGRQVTISGERKSEHAEHTDTFHRVERSSSRFSRSFTLPENADGMNVSACVENGVLKVTIPKRVVEPPAARVVNIPVTTRMH